MNQTVIILFIMPIVIAIFAGIGMAMHRRGVKASSKRIDNLRLRLAAAVEREDKKAVDRIRASSERIKGEMPSEAPAFEALEAAILQESMSDRNKGFRASGSILGSLGLPRPRLSVVHLGGSNVFLIDEPK